jgi:ubiquinone/menaquinone biosynthesis C-methylase UbiE
MESEAEAQRLERQARTLPVRAQLELTGLAPGMAALDAGCGPGVTSEVMADLVGPTGSVVALELSPERLAEARARCERLPQCRFVQADVRDTRLPDASFDYTWCQFVFEYLPRPEVALEELLRVTRPGGRVVVTDMDGIGDLNWPFPADLQEDFQKLVAAVTATGFDMRVGRKLFHMFRRAGLEDVRVHLSPLWLVAGQADERLLEDWALRLRVLEPVAVPAFGGVAAYRAFCERYLGLLGDPDSLKYAVFLMTEGRKR